MNDGTLQRIMSVGAELQPGAGVHFRVWAPKARQVRLQLEGGPGFKPGQDSQLFDLTPEAEGGYFSVLCPSAAAGQLYRFRLDDQPDPYPDPASRFQPEGPFGPSEVMDHAKYEWSDAAWGGLRIEGQVIYEMHVGTFTQEGTWTAAATHLPELVALGVTAVEMMPVADFPGLFGWGYDGVNWFAPTRLYGKPDDMRAFVNAAHKAGLGVILDVVYTHFGPDGNFLSIFSDAFESERHMTEWGKAINYDGSNSGPVRDFVLQNVAYWIRDFHVDGLRLDATHAIHDDSADCILAAIARSARAAVSKPVVLIAESDCQNSRLVRSPEEGGYGFDAIWNDDFHHEARVALTGRHEAYFAGYRGAPQEFISTVKHGYLYQGQFSRWQNAHRGTPALDIRPSAFVNYLENHDQIANSAWGLHLHALAAPGRLRALSALLLLGPGTPMLFQGQEHGSSRPFYFFADHHTELNARIGKGRAEFLAQFPSIASPEMQACLPNPSDPATFERCRLLPDERRTHGVIYALHRDLLHLRRTDPVFKSQRPWGVDGAVLGIETFVLRFFGGEAGDRLLLVNLGPDHDLEPVAEPLLAPPSGRNWALAWSSESPGYGGGGMHPVPDESNHWLLPGHSAMVLSSANV